MNVELVPLTSEPLNFRVRDLVDHHVCRKYHMGERSAHKGISYKGTEAIFWLNEHYDAFHFIQYQTDGKIVLCLKYVYDLVQIRGSLRLHPDKLVDVYKVLDNDTCLGLGMYECRVSNPSVVKLQGATTKGTGCWGGH